MKYQLYQAYSDASDPMRTVAAAYAAWLYGMGPGTPLQTLMRPFAAALDVFACTKITHEPPQFGITSVHDGIALRDVTETVAQRTPFCSLIHFSKEGAGPQPKVLIVAPMSGHFATLLRGTVRTMLRDHDVYVTQWHNARDVPLTEGRFGLDEYVQHIRLFLSAMGERSHVMAVCQPTVPTLAAVAAMAEEEDAAQPASMTLMAGPIDTRINPTSVNELANSRPIEWFHENLIGQVPLRYPGAMRCVYPGFLQLLAFMSMNPDRHVESFSHLYEHLAEGELEAAAPLKTFYAEYFAMSDLPAEFYLETVQTIFQEHRLPRGEFQLQGRAIDPAYIRRTALLTIEGEKDDICSIGQTMAAHDLCPSIRPYRKRHYVQTGVGHYGVFNGRRWNAEIYPLVRDFIHTSR